MVIKRVLMNLLRILNNAKTKNIFSSKCLKYEEFKNLKVLWSCAKCGSNNDKVFKEKDSVELLKILDKIDNINKIKYILCDVKSLQKTETELTH